MVTNDFIYLEGFIHSHIISKISVETYSSETPNSSSHNQNLVRLSYVLGFLVVGIENRNAIVVLETGRLHPHFRLILILPCAT